MQGKHILVKGSPGKLNFKSHFTATTKTELPTSVNELKGGLKAGVALLLIREEDDGCYVVHGDEQLWKVLLHVVATEATQHGRLQQRLRRRPLLDVDVQVIELAPVVEGFIYIFIYLFICILKFNM